MNRDTAVDLIRNLLERARETTEKTFLTSREIAALEILTEGGGKPEEPIARAILAVPAIADSEIDADTLLCIDFGTSFSKAFASVANGEAIAEIIDLPIGTAGSQPLLTPSEMIIDDEVLYFGAQEIKLVDFMEAPSYRLIDSIKQYMTLGADVANLARSRMEPAKDPSQKFFQRDILLLYLAHLTRLTENALEVKGVSINARRRFAHPAWTDQHRLTNQIAMKTMMAEAIVLARSLGDRLLDRLPAAAARAALDELKDYKGELPLNLIAEPVREATAAGAGALIGSRQDQREALVIVDIGAGTTDVAGFICVNNSDRDRPRIWEVSGAAGAIPSAGNVLDNALTKLVLDKCHATSGSTEYGRAAAFLNRNKRANKETLFRTGVVFVDLPTGEIVEVKENEFLEYAPVQSFSKKVTDLIGVAAIALNSGDPILVATGGGARLPIIRRLVEDGLTYEGRRFIFESRDSAPKGMAERYPDLVDTYPQIAVALGGSLPELPEQRSDIPGGPGSPTDFRPKYAEVIYKS